MTASSFTDIPGLPILHSQDLVYWEIIGHALAKQPPFDVYNQPQHGNGVWAPAIRYHDHQFYIYYPDPDYGIYLVKARNPAGPWSAPLLVKAAKGWIDPCPLWDDDGKAYLVNAFARSRAGINSVITVSRMSPNGSKLLDEGVRVYDGHDQDPTIEGPKFYRRNGYYYISAPAGGVTSGWQVVLRSRNVFGPYERKVVLRQGATSINGPHQGAWVDTPAGEFWFLHFQDKGPFGRILHLQPMKWEDDWPVMGNSGEPVLSHQKPNVGKAYPISTPADSDEFNGGTLDLQWQWNANPQQGWTLPSARHGALRLMSVPLPEGFRNFWDVPNLLLQKFPGPAFRATTKVTLVPRAGGEETGLIVMGADYAYVSVSQRSDAFFVSQTVCRSADKSAPEKRTSDVHVNSSTLFLRVTITDNALCQFSYGQDERAFTPIGAPFAARPGRWIGAKVGIFATRPTASAHGGHADFDWCRFQLP